MKNYNKKRKQGKRKERERKRGRKGHAIAPLQRVQNSSLQSYVLWAGLVNVATGTVLMHGNSTMQAYL